MFLHTRNICNVFFDCNVYQQSIINAFEEEILSNYDFSNSNIGSDVVETSERNTFTEESDYRLMKMNLTIKII